MLEGTLAPWHSDGEGPNVSPQITTTQAKLHYLRILNELPTFAGVLFSTVGLVQ